MAISRIQLTNFRSYSDTEFDLDPSVTIVVGPNASGKTNLLESLYVLASTKSFRAKDIDLVAHGSDYYRISAQADDKAYSLALKVNPNTEKRVAHDGVKQSLIHHIGEIQATLFEPTDLDLISGPPERRRKYLDYILTQTDKNYNKTLIAYKRVLKQRNALLDGYDVNIIRRQIFFWDVQLADLASDIYQKRLNLITYLNNHLSKIYEEISGTLIPINITYLPSVISDDYSNGFLEALSNNIERDIGAGFTTIGPHREDFKISFYSNDITTIASRGEVRSVVLALKLAEVTYSHEKTGIRPLLLLDDVFSELDSMRREHLINSLNGYQTIITTTDADAVVKDLLVPHSIIYTDKDSKG